MKNLFSYKFWLYYSAILSALLIAGGFYTSGSSKNLAIANWLFLPVVLFFWLTFIKFYKQNNPAQSNLAGSKFGFGLLIYCLLLNTVITIGGFVVSRSNVELVSNAIFLPLTVFCWYLFYTRPNKSKNNNPIDKRGAGIQNNSEEKNSLFNSGRIRVKNLSVEESETE